MWHVKSNRLYSGTDTTDTSNPVFIVGTQFNFGATYDDQTKANWTNLNCKVNRAAAGNTVYMCGDYLAYHADPPSGEGTGTSGGQRVIDLISNNYQINYFTLSMDFYNYKPGSETGWLPRASHSPWNSYNTEVQSGHWKRCPSSNSGDNTISTDPSYITSYTSDPSKWQNSNYYGTSNWHSNWLSRIRTGTAGLNLQYGKLFSWYLMDEPLNSDWYRDAATNGPSVSGHWSFCSGVENSGTPDTRPKMVDIRPSAEAAWTALNGQIDILCGNDYGYVLQPSLATNPWKNVNMVKWCWSKVTGNTNKMVMAWLPGFANSNTTSGEIHMKYMFYASMIEGARGILWYMSDDYQDGTPYSDYTNYRYLSGIFAGFTNDPTFKSDGGTKPDHMEFLLKGEKITSILVSPSESTDPTPPAYTSAIYGRQLANKISHLVWKYSNRWRVFVANNMNENVSFQVKIDDSNPPATGYSNAYDLSHASNQMTVDNGRYVLSGQLSAFGYNIYDIGPGNQ